MTTTHVRYDVRNAESGKSLDFTLPSSMTNGSGVERGMVSVSVSRSTSYSLDVMSFTERPAGVELTPETDDTPLYLDVTGDANMNRSLDSVTFDLVLSKADIDARGGRAEDIGVYRYHDGSWEQLESTVTENETEYVVQATSPGTSYYALGIKHPVASVSNVSAASDVAVGEPTTTTADVTNTGHADGNVTLSLLVDGDVVSNQSVSLAAGETTSVTFEHRYETAGTHTIELGDERADVRVRSGSTNSIELADVTADATTIGPGENVTLIATFSNSGDSDSETTLRFGVVGGETATRTVTVPAGQQRVVTVQQQLDSPGTYTLAVNDREVTVTVKEGVSKFDTADSNTDGQISSDSTSDESTGPRYGLEIVVVLIVGVISIALAGRLMLGRDGDN